MELRGATTMIVCSICKRFVSHVVYWTNGNDDIVKVEGTCKHHFHKRVPCDWDCYEDVAGWPKE